MALPVKDKKFISKLQADITTIGTHLQNMTKENKDGQVFRESIELSKLLIKTIQKESKNITFIN